MGATSTPRVWTAEGVRAFLGEVAAIAGRYARRPGLAFTCPEEFILQHGRAFTAAPLPPGVRRGPLGRCHANAWRLACRQPDLVYCEGYAAPPGGIPLPHAWCVRLEDGAALDPTWPDPEPGRPAAYVGVALQGDFVRRWRPRGAGLLLDDFDGGWPLLREGLAESEWKSGDAAAAPK